MGVCGAVLFFLRGFLVSRLGLVAENLALRQQLAVYQQTAKRPKLRNRDRFFSTNNTAVNTRRVSFGDRPPSGEAWYSGNNDSISFHNSSGSNLLDIAVHP